jgi:hypothetical protein
MYRYFFQTDSERTQPLIHRHCEPDKRRAWQSPIQHVIASPTKGGRGNLQFNTSLRARTKEGVAISNSTRHCEPDRRRAWQSPIQHVIASPTEGGRGNLPILETKELSKLCWFVSRIRRLPRRSYLTPRNDVISGRLPQILLRRIFAMTLNDKDIAFCPLCVSWSRI